MTTHAMSGVTRDTLRQIFQHWHQSSPSLPCNTVVVISRFCADSVDDTRLS